MTREDKFLGAMVGTGLGDAIGELAFEYPVLESLLAELERCDVLRYTDDTAMAIALAESLCDTGNVDSAHLGNTFRQHHHHEPWRGYGPGPPLVFAMVEGEGCPYEEAARRLYGGRGSMGNGAAMRIAPLGLFFCDSANLYDKARRSAEVTHAHPVGVDGAAVQAKAVAQAVWLEPPAPLPTEAFIDDLIGFAQTPAMIERLRRVQVLLKQQVGPQEAASRLGLSVRVDESMPFALYCFLCHNNSFEDCVQCAVLNGGDRDTMGAMAGAISGAYLGLQAIPHDWWNKLENLPHILSLAHELAARSSGGPPPAAA
jgi:poly(ADP-ribose) glycohydrolase ARH3